MSTERVITWTIREIEHSGDEEDAIDALHKAGCRNIRVTRRDYEGSESATFQFQPPVKRPDITIPELEELCPNVCF